jgi:hypothetical protein
MNIEKYTVASNGEFGLLKSPFEHKQHPNQQNGLDLYVRVVNFTTGCECTVKLYKSKKGLHFKMKGTHYLDDFDSEVVYVPFQIIRA